MWPLGLLALLPLVWTAGLGTVFLPTNRQRWGAVALGASLGVFGLLQAGLVVTEESYLRYLNGGGWSLITALGLAGLLLSGWEGGRRLGVRAIPTFETAPDTLDIQLFDRLREIPIYNGDLEEQGKPESVQALQDAVKVADLLLIVSPEYNRDIPGGLKNALDWVSRDREAMSGKPTAIMGASIGGFGTARMQAALRLSLVQTGNLVMAQPEIAVPFVDKKVEEGRLTNADTLKYLGRFMEAAAEWAALHKKQ